MPKGMKRSLDRGDKLTNGLVQYEKVRLDGDSITVASVGAADATGGIKIADFGCEGYLTFLGVMADLEFESSDVALADVWEGDMALGTALRAKGNVADAAAESNLLDRPVGPSADKDIARTLYIPASGDVSPAGTVLDATDGDGTLNLNLLVDNADSTDDTDIVINVTGTITVAYFLSGDN